MKKIGILGGVAWPSTLEYYRLLCLWANEHFRRQGAVPPYPTPPMTIESLDISQTRRLRGKPGDEASWQAFDAAYREGLLRLARAGCDFGLIANNTSHSRLPSIRAGLALPIVSILTETARATRAAGARRALLLGTSVTLRADAYAAALKAEGVAAEARLPEEVIDGVQALIDEEFDKGATPRGRSELLALCRRFVQAPKETAVLLACTELPLAFPEHAEDGVFESEGFTFVNTVAVHARAALDKALGLERA